MKKLDSQKLRELCLGKSVFPNEVLNWISEKNLWNLWVPKKYGGLELSLTQGLDVLKEIASIDGSLGWTVTLCSGANYFIGNLPPEAAKEIFINTEENICLGGSGAISGRAEKAGDYYRISGKWRYATGSFYLSHFTLNAEIYKDGKPILDENAKPVMRSFIVPKKEVKIFEDWNTMGLKASVTHSFSVEDVELHKKFSFVYNQFYQPQDIFKIPFSVFADLSLWVNYIGMATHFLEASKYKLRDSEMLYKFDNTIIKSGKKLKAYSEEIERTIGDNQVISEMTRNKIHKNAVKSVRNISRNIINIYPLLGILASRENQEINQLFRDYFTATQHHIFTK